MSLVTRGKTAGVRIGFVALCICALLSGCSAGDTSGGRSGANDLEVTRTDGTKVEFQGKVTAWCGPLDELRNTSEEGDPAGETAIHIFGGELPGENVENPRSFWFFSRARNAIEDEPELELPDDDEPEPSFFVFDAARQNELSSYHERSSGTIEVANWPGCREGEEVRLVVDGRLDSEISDQPTAEVEGEIVTIIGDGPPVPD
jgi:hypothetical protein